MCLGEGKTALYATSANTHTGAAWLSLLALFSYVLADGGPIQQQPLHLPWDNSAAAVVDRLKAVHDPPHWLQGEELLQRPLVLFGGLPNPPGLAQLLR